MSNAATNATNNTEGSTMTTTKATTTTNQGSDIKLNCYYRLKKHPIWEGVAIQILPPNSRAANAPQVPHSMIELESLHSGETCWYPATDLELS